MKRPLRIFLFLLFTGALVVINGTWFGSNMLAAALGGALFGLWFRPFTKDNK